MKIKLGYVAISLTLNLTTSKTTTYTYYQKLNSENKYQKLNTLINQNLENLKKILWYNFKNGIYFYRISHNIVPLATHPKINFDYIKPYEKKWKQLGFLIKLYNIRVDTHPDQFCVLNSPNKKIVSSSIQMLKFHQSIFNAMQINGKAILHIGGVYNDKKEAIKRFIANFKKLDQKLQNIIILENDDKSFNVKDVLYICETLNIPMVLDYHHYKCNNENENLNDYLPRIINTWKNEKLNPKMHFSSPKNTKDFRSHSAYLNSDDFIEFINILKPYNINIDIMLECKGKDDALFKLIRELKFKTNYNFINETIFEIY